jgi:hypothetical protein
MSVALEYGKNFHFLVRVARYSMSASQHSPAPVEVPYNSDETAGGTSVSDAKTAFVAGHQKVASSDECLYIGIHEEAADVV